MAIYPYQIVIIDDDPEFDTRPVFYELADKYGEQNIIWKQDPKDGIDYIKNHLNKRTVVILDYSFKSNQNGLAWFQQMQKMSSLLYVILYTNKFDMIPIGELEDFINNHLMGIVSKVGEGNDYPKLLKQVEHGFEYLSRGVDVCLEEWIMSLDEDERAEKNIISRSGRSWSLDDLLQEIRQRTPEGIEAEKNIITLSLDLINRGRRDLYPNTP
jgi:DNA-binding NtrC family response regulator